jgi:diketogulonate reductase-like aldo/keto reductase
MMAMTNLRTASGREIHPIGIGTWDVASHKDPSLPEGKYGRVEPFRGRDDKEIEAITFSLAQGQNHIDCAELYGAFYTDEVVGRALKEAGAPPRSDLFIADKLWKTSVGDGKVRPTVVEMLRKLNTDYLDLLYIHAPWIDAPWKEALAQIDQLIDEQLVRFLGVSNFTVADMETAMNTAKHPVAMNQIHYNVLDQGRANTQFRDFCRRNDVQIVAYQPLKRQAVIESSTLREIARAHWSTPVQVALAWLRQMGTLAIPKATTKAHIDENLRSLNLVLSDAEMTRLTLPE